MTEAEWLACDDPNSMLAFLGHLASERKLRLFACACCRRLWRFHCDEGRCDVEVSERYADGLATGEELRAAHGSASNVHLGADAAITYTNDTSEQLRWECVAAQLTLLATLSSLGTTLEYGHLRVAAANQRSRSEQADLLRDIFGNPFHPVAFAPEWRTSTVVALAQQMYDSRDFSATPILADALQDAGCDNAAVLEHCRGPGPHVRGCWVVDSLLDRG